MLKFKLSIFLLTRKIIERFQMLSQISTFIVIVLIFFMNLLGIFWRTSYYLKAWQIYNVFPLVALVSFIYYRSCLPLYIHTPCDSPSGSFGLLRVFDSWKSSPTSGLQLPDEPHSGYNCLPDSEHLFLDFLFSFWRRRHCSE